MLLKPLINQYSLEINEKIINSRNCLLSNPSPAWKYMAVFSSLWLLVVFSSCLVQLGERDLEFFVSAGRGMGVNNLDFIKTINQNISPKIPKYHLCYWHSCIVFFNLVLIILIFVFKFGRANSGFVTIVMISITFLFRTSYGWQIFQDFVFL